MKRLSQLRDTYDTILNSPHPTKLKTAMLAAVAAELRLLASTARSENAEAQTSTLKSEQAETYYTVSQLSLNSYDLSLNSRILPAASQGPEREELEGSILQKQRIKISLNEEIENFEDDYFQLQKILLTKKEYLEDLDNRIAKRTYEISKQSCQLSEPPGERKSLTHRIRNFFLL